MARKTRQEILGNDCDVEGMMEGKRKGEEEIPAALIRERHHDRGHVRFELFPIWGRHQTEPQITRKAQICRGHDLIWPWIKLPRGRPACITSRIYRRLFAARARLCSLSLSLPFPLSALASVHPHPLVLPFKPTA